jgi:phage major head subunit gpT-like protein
MDKPTDPNVFMSGDYYYGVDARGNAGLGLWQLAFGSKAELTEANYAAAREAMMSMKGDNGRPMNLKPDLLVCAPVNEGPGKKILEAEYLVGGGTNVYQNTAKLLSTGWLA